MFRLINYGSNWHIIFLLLSLEKTDALLQDILFPSNIDLTPIRPLARTFVEQYAINLNSIHYWKDLEQAQLALATKTYTDLVAVLGEKEAEQFSEWGNQFEINTDLEKSVSAIWTFHLKPLPQPNYERLPLTQQSKEIMLSILNPVMEREKLFLLKLDEYETSPRSTWEERAIWIYNGGTDYTPNIEDFTHPFDYFPVLWRWLDIPPALKEIHSKLNANEFKLLNDWLNSEFQRKNIKHLLDLQTILEQI